MLVAIDRHQRKKKMMHRCSSSSHGNSVGPCSCGLFHSQSNSLSMLFSMPNNHKPFDEAAAEMYSFASPSSSVDCTLSLGTPSTRLTEDDEKRMRHDYRRNDSCVPNFCWDLLQNKHNNSAPTSHKNGSRGSNNNTTNNSGSDPLLARRCANCDTTSTPLWRNGPRGPKVCQFNLINSFFVIDVRTFFFFLNGFLNY